VSKSGLPPLYLWVCCEGWQRLGPFDWVALSEDGLSFVDQTGAPVLIYDRNYRGWRNPKRPAMVYRTPMVTSQRKHPRPMSGELPFDPTEEQ
jgi:hypothetical protein